MRLAVLAQPIGQRFHAPIFGLGDGAAHSFDDALQMCRQFLHLLRAGVLARKVDVLVERHRCPFLRCRRSPRREAPRTLRERLECSEGGNTGRRTGKVLPGPDGCGTRPSVQPPAGVERKNRPYTRPAQKGKADQATAVRRLRRAVWINSASRTARVTPSRICPRPAAAGLARLALLLEPAQEGLEVCCKSFCRNAGSVRARDSSASVTGEKELIGAHARPTS